MQPFSWSDAELTQSKVTDHDRTEKRYSVDNENFDYRSLLEVIWVLEERNQPMEGATYYAADFALVDPECCDEAQIDVFLDRLETSFFEKFEHARQGYFKDADAVAKGALLRAIEGWIVEHVFVEPQWRMVGESVRLTMAVGDTLGVHQLNFCAPTCG